MSARGSIQMLLARVRVACELTVDNVRAEFGDDVADYVELSLEDHLRSALNTGVDGSVAS